MDFKKWVEMGAPWPGSPEPVGEVAYEGGYDFGRPQTLGVSTGLQA